MSKKLAKRVIDTFPSFDEMLEDLKKSKYYKLRAENPRSSFLQEIEHSKGKWFNYQIIVDVINNWLTANGGERFHDSYCVRTKAYTGGATVLDAEGNKYEVDGHTFIALTKIIFMSHSQYYNYSRGLTQEQFDAQDDFKFNVDNMYKIIG